MKNQTQNGLIIAKIKALDENSTEQEILEIAKYDFKIEVLNDTNNLNPFKRMEKYKASKSICDCDRCSSMLEIYKELEWISATEYDENQYVYGKPVNNSIFEKVRFDTINSISLILQCTLAIYFKEDFNFKYKNGEAIAVIDNKGKYISNESLSCFLSSKISELNLDYLRDFIVLVHSLGNFMICPGYKQPYSDAKTKCEEIKDFMDLFLLKIYDKNEKIYYTSKGKNYEIFNYVKKNWYQWFEENRSVLLLGDYFDDNSNENINLLFKEHSFSHSLITTENQIKECVEEINRRIWRRGLRMISKLNPKVGGKCKQLISSYPTDSAQNAVDMFPRTDWSKDINAINSSHIVHENI